MKKSSLISLIFAALAAVSCADALLEEEQAQVLYVSEGEPQTRVQLGESLRTQWNAGDLLTVFYFSDRAQKWKFDGQTGDTSGTLSLVDSGSGSTFNSNESLALYPYSTDNVRTDVDAISTVLPRTQNYAPDSFGPGAALMLGWSYGKVYKMYHLCGFVDLRLKGTKTVRSITLSGNNHETLNGPVSIDSQTLTMDLTVSSTDDGDPTHSLSMDCAGGVQLDESEETSFILALAPATFELGVSAVVEYTDGTSETRTCEACMAVRRNTMVTVHDNGGEVADPSAEIVPYEGETASDAAMDVVTDDEDFYWEAGDFGTQVIVTYNGTSAGVKTSSSKVITRKSGAHVTIDLETNSVKGVEIVLRGVSGDGSLKVYSDKKYKLTLDGVDLTSTKGPAVNSQGSKRVFVHLNAGTSNYLCDASSYSDDAYYPSGVTSDAEDRKGCFFSEGHLIFSGTGVLIAKGLHNHAIATDGLMAVRPGVTIVIPSAAGNGLKVKGDEDDGIGLRMLGGLIFSTVGSTAGKAVSCDYNADIRGGRMVLNTTGDSYLDENGDLTGAACLKVDGSLTMSGGTIVARSSGTGGKGISVDGDFCLEDGSIDIATSGAKYRDYYDGGAPKGLKVDGNLTVNGGDVLINVTGNSSGSEGMEGKNNIYINGGEISITAYDDAINAGNLISVSGGRLYCYSVDNDGIDSNGYMSISGGVLISSGSAAPEEAFDCDRSENFTITGGTLIGTSGTSVDPSSYGSTQNTVIYQGINLSTGTMVAICDSAGDPLLMYEIPRTMNRGMNLFFSSPDLSSGKTYTVYSGGSATGYDESWHGWYPPGAYTAGSKLTTFTTSGTVTKIGTGTGGGGGGGTGGGGRRW